MATGFFVPASVSDEYVANKRTITGEYQWDTHLAEVGLQQQAALQAVNKQYSTTISNAYTSYLAASRGVRGSGMGEGYKQEYMKQMQAGLRGDVIGANVDAARMRGELAAQGTEMVSNIASRIAQETDYMDRVSGSMEGYLGYLKGLTSEKDTDTSYLTPEQAEKSVSELYDTLLGAQPTGYIDIQGEAALPYTEWVRRNLKDTELDRSWSRWLFGQGGLQQFRHAVSKGIKATD